MNYAQIQQFLVLSKTMNMTKAAKELFITQPALSHSFSKMEEELGLKLAYRDGNRLIMTEEGKKILEDFKKIEATYDDMFQHANQIREDHQKHLTLGFSGSITAFYSIFAYGILSSHRGINVKKIFADYSVIDSMLQNGMIDFAITFPPLKRKNVESHILVNDPLGLAIAGGHPILKKYKIRLSDLQSYKMVGLTGDNLFASYLNELLQKRNISIAQEEMGYNELMEVVERGKNKGEILAFSSRKQFASWFGTGYRYLPIVDFRESLVTAVSWKVDSMFSQEYKELVDYLEKWYDRIYYRNYTIFSPE